mmetsp:Transcript_18328/g.42415  ORF Transcript_18328/g.42415 Transcript_18328/m.42415 type:complete len:273 (+) Transcript_18328:410-1228(+)
MTMPTIAPTDRPPPPESQSGSSSSSKASKVPPLPSQGVTPEAHPDEGLKPSSSCTSVVTGAVSVVEAFVCSVHRGFHSFSPLSSQCTWWTVSCLLPATIPTTVKERLTCSGGVSTMDSASLTALDPDGRGLAAATSEALAARSCTFWLAPIALSGILTVVPEESTICTFASSPAVAFSTLAVTDSEPASTLIVVVPPGRVMSVSPDRVTESPPTGKLIIGTVGVGAGVVVVSGAGVTAGVVGVGVAGSVIVFQLGSRWTGTYVLPLLAPEKQ